MKNQACVELRDLEIDTDIGTFGPNDSGPDKHLLNLILQIGSQHVLIAEDGMAFVFDYDPLMAEIHRLAGDCHYETQERLITRIVKACAGCAEVESVEVTLRKFPVHNGSGSLGVRLSVDATTLAGMR
ncbi:dihydroneopterin aldolase [Actimicrobium sp. CCI2.3]|uniref:dihydroneopterin aldolase n=1 Tax=Actimicrobium sp. CCI2.3 TaxID=3048616 RepID=UPI002AB4E091|nr:dihydroneopterin aldolase [Actimicrobium sp. CCI2.3]MDY7575166.1 dihydroneopterin aldolase [Actimicrobium sp. CCI2.3]MEB0023582.1 dihydroneopterin aldolase [Actimicrobium sp. CCI2.3]